MLFSFACIKKFIPDLEKTISEVAADLSTHAFETDAVNDDALEIAVPPNRFSDAASHEGIAREIAALYRIDLPKEKSLRLRAQLKNPFEIIIEDKDGCIRLAARYFENIKIAESPLWMQEVLRVCGMRPINNVVDITNYVTLLTGQPLHAFDADVMDGRRLRARRARKDEVVETLDGQKILLDEDMTVLADDVNALDIAGIKGGRKAEIGTSTTSILLTAGNFEGTRIYKTSRKVKIRTDASTRFSHTISPALVPHGIEQASVLLQKLCGGIISDVKEEYKGRDKMREIAFDIDRFNVRAGFTIKKGEAYEIVHRLGFGTKGTKIIAPLFRTDIESWEDIAEEIIRMYGYENIAPQAPMGSLTEIHHSNSFFIKEKIRTLLMGMGFDEVYASSFISENDAEKIDKEILIELENPVSAFYQYFRPTLLANLLKLEEGNRKHFEIVRLYEIGKVAHYKEDRLDETLKVAGFISSKDDAVFFTLKGIVMELLRRLRIKDYSFKEALCVPSFFKKGECLEIMSGTMSLGYVGTRMSFSNAHSAVFELDCNLLLQSLSLEYEYKPLSKYPSIIRDLSFFVAKSVRFEDMIIVIRKVGVTLLESIDLLDTYEGSKKDSERKSLTVRIVFQSQDRTLTDEEVNKCNSAITETLKEKFDIELR